MVRKCCWCLKASEDVCTSRAHSNVSIQSAIGFENWQLVKPLKERDMPFSWNVRFTFQNDQTPAKFSFPSGFSEGDTGLGPLHRQGWAGSDIGFGKPTGPRFRPGPKLKGGGEAHSVAKIIASLPAWPASPWLSRTRPCCQPRAALGSWACPTAQAAWGRDSWASFRQDLPYPCLLGWGKTISPQLELNVANTIKLITAFWLGP